MKKLQIQEVAPKYFLIAETLFIKLNLFFPSKLKPVLSNSKESVSYINNSSASDGAASLKKKKKNTSIL